VPPGSKDQYDLEYLPAFEDLRRIGAPVISVRNMIGDPSTWDRYFIPHDGHPTVLLNRMVGEALAQYFQKH
jgi:hypothetical protein